MIDTDVASILVIDDDTAFAETICELVEQEGYRLARASTLREGIDLLKEDDFDLVLLDVYLPDGNGLAAIPRIQSAPSAPEVIIMTAFGDPDGADLALKNGAWDYLEKTPEINSIMLPILRALQYREARTSAPQAELYTRAGILGNSGLVRSCLEFMARVAPTDTSVLIKGETGTGKELFARAIHENSRRRKGPYIVVDCASLPSNLIGSALFGHERGAFTGADRTHEGLVRQAHGGTLFLDEIAELPLDMQTAFLRVLQEHRFRPLGSAKEMESNFRLLAATNRNIEEMTQQGRFRSDLFYRLGAAVLTVPPLREHPEDITELAMAYLSNLCARSQVPMKGFSPDFLEVLFRYDWPGNVRELFHVLETTFAGTHGETILFARDLPLDVRRKAREDFHEKSAAMPMEHGRVEVHHHASYPTLQDARNEAADRAERHYIENLLNMTGGAMKRALALSGLSRSQLYRLMKKHGLRRFDR